MTDNQRGDGVEREFAKIANYNFIRQNLMDECVAAEEARFIESVREARSLGSHCVCTEKEGRKCTDAICINRKNCVSCPESCGTACQNNPWRNGGFASRDRITMGKVDVDEWGVFATSSIRKDQFVGIFVGEMLQYTEELESRDGTFMVRLKNVDLVIDATRNGNIMRQIRTSGNGNCAKIMYVHEFHLHVVILVTRDISVGEELTFLDSSLKCQSENANPCDDRTESGQSSQKIIRKESFSSILPYLCDKGGKHCFLPGQDGKTQPQSISPKAIIASPPLDYRSLHLVANALITVERPAQYSETFNFNLREVVYAIVNVDGAFRIYGGVVIGLGSNAHQLHFVQIKLLSAANKCLLLPKYACFHHFEDAQYSLQQLFTKDDRKDLLTYDAFTWSNLRMEARILRDFEEKVKSGELENLEITRTETECATAIGHVITRLRKRETPLPSFIISLDRPASSLPPEDTRFQTLEATYDADFREPLCTNGNEGTGKNFMHPDKPTVLFNRSYAQMCENVTWLVLSRIDKSLGVTFPEIAHTVDYFLQFHYFKDQLEERRYMSFTDYRMATEIAVPGSWNILWCSLCKLDKIFKNRKELHRHYCSHHSIIAKQVTCTECNTIFYLPSKYRLHVAKCNPKASEALLGGMPSWILDGLADYKASRSVGNSYHHVISPGIPNPRNKVNPRKTNKDGNQIFKMDLIELKPKNEGADNRSIEMTATQFDIQGKYKTLDSWDDLKFGKITREEKTNQQNATKTKPADGKVSSEEDKEQRPASTGRKRKRRNTRKTTKTPAKKPRSSVTK